MAELEIVVEWLRIPQGPVVMPDGCVILVEIEAGWRATWAPPGSLCPKAESW